MSRRSGDSTPHRSKTVVCPLLFFGMKYLDRYAGTEVSRGVRHTFTSRTSAAMFANNMAIPLLLLTTMVRAAAIDAQDTRPVPPLPSFEQLSLPNAQPMPAGRQGEVMWIENGRDSQISFPQPDKRCYRASIVKQTWNPATGVFSSTPLALGGLVTEQVATPSGIWFLVSSECAGESGRVALLSADGKLTFASTPRSIFRARMVVLTDGSVAAITVFGPDDSQDARSRDAAKRHFRTTVVRRGENGLAVESMPDLPIPSRDDYAVAAITAGRLMVLGGSDDQYRGCSACRAGTHILDPMAKTWTAGPDMLEPRSEHNATRLPDGSILVTGGWTPAADWGKGPSRSAERWNPASNRFETVAPMPSGTARHQAIGMPGQEDQALLMAAGTNASVFAFDIGSGSWKTVGALRQGSEEGGCLFVPFQLAGNTYAWSASRSEGFYSSKSCAGQAWELATLQLDTGAVAEEAPSRTAVDDALVTYQLDGAFLPASSGRPAMLIGGRMHAGMNAYLLTTAAMAIGPGGRIRPVPTLNEPRSNAMAFRVGNGVLVAGGWGENRDDRAPQRPTPPMEWLATDAPQDGMHWVTVAESGLSEASAFGQLADGNFIEVDPQGKVTRLALVFRAGNIPAIARSEFPPLDKPRQPSSGYGYDVRIRGLSDGRVVVAGGDVQEDKIALLTLDSDSNDAPDEYVGIGPYRPSTHYEIYDPASKRWHTSASSQGAGGRVAILDDGRVVKVGHLFGDEASDTRYVFEISSADGTSWTPFPAMATSKMKLSDAARPFVVDGELFLSGELASLSTGGGPSGVEWFNTTTRQWEVLWQAGPKDNWRDHVGRMIVRQLSNGKVVVLPVNGF